MTEATFHKSNCKTYFDSYLKTEAIKILPGEYHATNGEEMVVTTLGSCISACIRDTRLGIGGMNHFMLPQSEAGEWAGASASSRYGNFAMEYLINEILKLGGSKLFMEAKIFGGGQMFGETQLNVGRRNENFALEYLKTEGIKVAAQDVGGAYSRKVYFQPSSGKVMLKKLTVLKNDTILKREKEYEQTLATDKIEGDIELF